MTMLRLMFTVLAATCQVALTESHSSSSSIPRQYSSHNTNPSFYTHPHSFSYRRLEENEDINNNNNSSDNDECLIYQDNYTRTSLGVYSEHPPSSSSSSSSSSELNLLRHFNSLETLQTIRHSSENSQSSALSWYKKILDALFLLKCHNDPTAKTRYVLNTNSKAYCRYNDIASDFDPPPDGTDDDDDDDHDQRRSLHESGLYWCEIVETCYWKAPVAGAPRERFYNDDMVMEAAKIQTSYGLSIIKYFLVLLGCAILNFVVTFIYFVARCLFRCSCTGAPPLKSSSVGGGDDRRKATGTCGIVLPILIFLISSTAILIVGYGANMGNTKVTHALNRTFHSIDKGTTDLQFFFGTAARPLTRVKKSVDGAVSLAQLSIDDSSWVKNDTIVIRDRLVAFVEAHRSNLDRIGAAGAADGITSQLDDRIDPIVGMISEVLATLEGELVMAQEMIDEGVSAALNRLEEMNNTVTATKTDLARFRQTNENLLGYRKIGVLSLFAIVFVFIALGLIGLVSAFTPCKCDDYLEYLLHFTWMFGSLIGTCSFLLGGVAITLAVTWSDICQFMSVVTEDFSTYLGPQVGTGLNACFENTPLMEAFNMTESLDFAAPLEAQLDGVVGINVSANFELVKGPVNELGAALRGIDELAWMAVYGLNNLTHVSAVLAAQGLPTTTCCYEDRYSLDNVRQPWLANVNKTNMCLSNVSYERQGNETGKHYMTRLYSWPGCDLFTTVNDNIITIWDNVDQLIDAQTNMISDLGTDGTSFCDRDNIDEQQQQISTCPANDSGRPTIMSAITNYERKMITLVNQFRQMGTTLVGDLITNVEDFSCNMKCGFLASFYENLEENWCEDLLVGFLDISVSLVLLALFNIPVCVCAALLVDRFRGRWRCGVGAIVFAGADAGGRKMVVGDCEEEEEVDFDEEGVVADGGSDDESDGSDDDTGGSDNETSEEGSLS